VFQSQESDGGHSVGLRREGPKVEPLELLDDPGHLRVGFASQIGPKSGEASGWDPLRALNHPLPNFILLFFQLLSSISILPSVFIT